MIRPTTKMAIPIAGTLLLVAGVSCRARDADKAVRPLAAAAARPNVAGTEPLKGRWVRADGGYLLEIRSITPEGAIDASYLNPRPIHVERAQASRAGEVLTLFVELSDENYPGSTYSLWYNPATDALQGTYFQAVEQQTFDVAFARH